MKTAPEINFDVLEKLSLYDFKSEGELISAVDELSQVFTLAPEQIPDYYQREKYIGAYLYYFFSTHLPKLESIYSTMDLEKYFALGLPFIDFGAGPGTATISWLEQLKKYKNPVLMIESSVLMRKQADRNLDYFAPDLDVEIKDIFNEESSKYREGILCFTHSLNEMSETQFFLLCEKVNPKVILFIEPGTKAVFSKALSLRSKLVKKDYDIVYPCASSAMCPMQLNETNWCHQYVKVQHDISVERMCQILGKDRRLQPFLGMCFVRDDVVVKKNPESSMLIRTFAPTKHSFEWELCSKKGKLLELERVEISKRGLDKEHVDDISRMLPGRSIAFSVEKELTNKKRIRLIGSLEENDERNPN